MEHHDISTPATASSTQPERAQPGSRTPLSAARQPVPDSRARLEQGSLARYLKLAGISVIVTCMLMPLTLILLRFARVRWEMRDPIQRSIQIAGIATGVSAAQVIIVFLLLFCASLLLCVRLLNQS